MSLERSHLMLGLVLVALIAGACKADEQRSETADREAAILALVVALDQTMLLSDEQREDLLVLLSDRWQGTWRTPRSWHGLIYPSGTSWQAALTRAAFAVLDVPEAELAPLLHPAQLAVCHELRVYAQMLGQRRTGKWTEPRQPEILFELSLDDVAEVCQLTDDLRTRLQFAGKLDASHSQESAGWMTRHRRANQSDPTARAITEPSFPAGTLPDDLPRYRKALRQWLTTEQRERLEAAHRRRLRFERRAELAAIARIVHRDVTLSESQCARLSDWLEERLGEASPSDDAVSVRAELLVALSRLSVDDVAGVVGAERSKVAVVWNQLRASGIPISRKP